MNYIKKAALNAGIPIIDYALNFSPPLAKSHSIIDHIIFHHDVWRGGTMKSIHEDHQHHRGYRGTGYHGRFPVGGGIELGRPHSMVGGHCKQKKMNYRSTGLVWEGNLDIGTMSPEQFEDSTKFLAEYIKLTDIPIDNIFGHCDFANKTCPGKNFPMVAIKERVQELLTEQKNQTAQWAKSGRKFVMDKKVNGQPISDGTRPTEFTTRQEQWVMMEQFYQVLINEFIEMMEAIKC